MIPLWKQQPKYMFYYCKECAKKKKEVLFEVVRDYHIKHCFKLQCPECGRKSYFLDIVNKVI